MAYPIRRHETLQEAPAGSEQGHGEPEAPGTPGQTALDVALADAVARGQAAWPELRLAAAAFLARLRAAVTGTPSPLAALRELNIPDLYLASACLERVPGALEVFETRYLTRLPVLLEHCPDVLPMCTDIGQILRERLFVGTADTPPRISQYLGRGALWRWLQVAATRIGLKLLEGSRRQIGGEPAERLLDLLQTADPELDYLKQRYRPQVKQAFEAAFECLSLEQRNLLRLHLLERLSIDALCVIFHCHRATAARRIERAHAALLQAVKHKLQAELALPAEELDSLLQLVRSQLDLSIHRLLGGDSEDG